MIDLRRYTLPNGLRVVHNYDPQSVMLAVNVVYDTGARDESRSLTGIAHLFEHLMFGGSVHIPAFDKELERAGGISNAWTSSDFTSFYDVLPGVNADTAFHLESDRMLALSFSPAALETQRKVVIEEFKQQVLNRPYGKMMHALRTVLYSAEHPYSWPVIGIEPDHIARVTDADVRSWFYAHYAPNNAVLALSGNLPYDEGRRKVEEWFGDIPAREIAPRRLPAPGFPTANRTITATDAAIELPMLVIAIPMAAYGTRGYFAADCITDLLSAGKSSRIYRNVIAGGDGTVVEADASIAGSEHEGFVMLMAILRDGEARTLARAEEMLMEQLRALSEPGNLTEHELTRTFNRFASTFAMRNFDPLSRANNLAMAELHGEDINATVERQRSLTIAEITAEAHRLANAPHIVVHYMPAES